MLLSEMLRLGTVMCKDLMFHVMNLVFENVMDIMLRVGVKRMGIEGGLFVVVGRGVRDVVGGDLIRGVYGCGSSYW